MGREINLQDFYIFTMHAYTYIESYTYSSCHCMCAPYCLYNNCLPGSVWRRLLQLASLQSAGTGWRNRYLFSWQVVIFCFYFLIFRFLISFFLYVFLFCLHNLFCCTMAVLSFLQCQFIWANEWGELCLNVLCNQVGAFCMSSMPV